MERDFQMMASMSSYAMQFFNSFIYYFPIGQAALHLAAMNGHIHVVQLLRCFGANVNAAVSECNIW